ncbi:MAG TPA: chitobiase/beta-hexosaminidase C-terminal domain-containing protein, partial [Candidatus Sulfotelmatobacter sp.]|nr:chitobiase/beta-hexosaminidase C-terminal domain-containing protein [Candidatus Sulfotelmatobacter sp.]
HDSVYAFDADSNGGANTTPLWQVSLIDSAHGAGSGETPVPNGTLSTADIVPQIGITGTPVIDPTTNTMYVVAKSTISSTTFIQRLHALDITTGQEKFDGPVQLAAQVTGNGNGSTGNTLQFDSKWENNRPGLLLLNGIVYIGFGSHGDNGAWHGWILSYNAASLHQISALCITPNGEGSGVWQGGAGLAADVPDPVNHPYGRMFISTGNGTYDATTPFANGMDYGDDDIRLDLTNGVLTVQDSFTPSNQANLSSADQDLGSGGAVLLPPQSGAHPNELVQVGKSGTIYVVDRDSMGGYSTTSDNIVQEFGTEIGGIWGMPAYWNGNVYVWGKNDNLKAFSVTGDRLSSGPTSVGPDESGFPAPTPAISSNGTTNGIVWAIQTDAYLSEGNEILRAYDATNVANELYNSSQNSSRDVAPIATKFIVPTVANGKVYVTGSGKVSVYGLLSGTQTVATPVISPAGQSFATSVSVTITDSTAGATIFYTTDGTTPSSTSTKYTAPITVSTTETITAIATATGFINSQPASQTYTSTTQTATPTFNPTAGSYAGAQTVTLADSTPASKIYFTVDNSTPAPGVGSTQLYSAPITVNQTITIKAIATSTGLSNSAVASALFTIGPAAPTINFPNGFAAATATMTFNGSTDLDDSRLQLTNGGIQQAGSAFFNTPVNIQSFTTDFTMQLSNAVADGMTFAIQNVGPTALGPAGGGLGYGPDLPANPDPSPNTPIANSVAVKFDFFSNAGEGNDSTGLYTNGASPTTPAVDLSSTGIRLNSGDTMSVHLAYDGTNLSLTITDTVANATFTQTWPINIPQTIGGNTAYVGFTGATGGSSSSQKIETWSFTSNTSPTGGVATPMISPASGTYAPSVSVSITDTTPNSTIYYTTDGSTPTTMSTQYSGAFNVSTTSTVKTFATANGLTASAVASAAYTIATPFTVKAESTSLTVAAGAQATSTIMVAPPTGGTFTGAVTLTCAVTGAAPIPTCSLSPSSVTPGTQGATSTLTISVPASAAVLASPPHEFNSLAGWKIVSTSGTRLAMVTLLASAIMLLVTWARYQHRFRPRYAWLTAALFLALLQTACGGGGGTSTSPPESSSQQYTVTVTGTSTTANSVKIQDAANITVTVP